MTAKRPIPKTETLFMNKIISPAELKKIVAEIEAEPLEQRVARLTQLHRSAPVNKRKRIRLYPLDPWI